MSHPIRGLIGSRAFYRMVLGVVVPIIIQNTITNFVSLLDNLMVGSIGTEQMSGVAITNQLIFVFSLTIFGTISGAGIFASQYSGAGNDEGVRVCMRYKMIASTLIVLAAAALFYFAGTPLINLFLTDNSDPMRTAETLGYALEYMRIMLIGFFPFAMTQCYASTLRETGETRIPMLASIIAVLVNMLFNYLLIFGKLFFPVLGVRGAAIATVLSRYAELAFIALYTHLHNRHYRFARGLFRTLRVPRASAWMITQKAMPLLGNELLWSLGVTTLSQIYSLRGLDVVAALNIASTTSTLFSTVYMSMGNSSGIIVGRELGANHLDTARDYCWKLVAFATALSFVFGGLLAAVSGLIPQLYNTTSSVRSLASSLILVLACLMPLFAIPHSAYFIMRAGGKIWITMLFDSGFSWMFFVPIAFCLTHFCPNMHITMIYFCVQAADILKAVYGIYLLKRGTWLNNMVAA